MRRRRFVSRLLRALAAATVVLLAAPCAIGLLYLLRQHHAPAAGELLRGALPLQQLAGGDAQPLSRVAPAFAAAGIAAGAGVGLLTRARPPLVAAATGLLGWTLLLLTGAVSDAIANAYRLGPRLQPQLTHRGLWAEALFLAAGALLGAALGRRARRPRPARAQEGHTPAEHARAAQLVAVQANDSLDPFSLREDRSFQFGDDGLISYRVVGGTAVVGGGPIAPAGQTVELLRAFERDAAAGRRVVMTGVSQAQVMQLRAAGYRALQIGVEAFVDPARFTLVGRPVRKLRQSIARVQRAGWQLAAVEAGDLSPWARAQIDAVERDWRARQPRMQGFAMTLGRLWGAPEDDRALFVLARDPDGEIASFLRFARYRDGLSLDAMRRAQNGPNGLCESMVAVGLMRAADEGAREVSLNFAGFGHVMAAEPGALPWRQRLLRQLLRLGGGRFQLERLVRFNAKFAPEWRPRYLLYRGRLGLLPAGLRVLQAEAYIDGPRGRELSGRWHAQALPAAEAAAAAPPFAPRRGTRLAAGPT